MADSTYSTIADLKIGDLPLPGYVDKQKYVNDAADEIDSYLGYRYVTPIDMSDTPGTVSRPARLTLKRIAAHLSTGRIILAVAVSSEDANLHSYGKMMVEEALASLKQIMEGAMPIEGALSVDTGTAAQAPSGPTILNIDQFSTVEAFYQTFALPSRPYGESERVSGG